LDYRLIAYQKNCAVGAPHRAVQGGLQEVLIWPWWVSDTFCGSMFYVFCMGTGCFKNLGSGVPCSLEWGGIYPKTSLPGHPKSPCQI